MILILNRKNPIRFPPLRHTLAGLYWTFFWKLRRLRIFPGGAYAMASNLLKELSEAPNLHWRICYRVPPSNTGVDAVWVIHDGRDLEWAVRNKKELKTTHLWAGPAVVIVPEDSNGVITSPAVDHFIVPCDWVAQFFAQAAPTLKNRLVVWPVGLDMAYWAPHGGTKRHLLIYNKFQNTLTKDIVLALKSSGVTSEVITYGRYDPAEYRERLKDAWGLVWLSRSETQGLAVMEAMSMNVPVLAWDPGSWRYTDPSTKKTFSHAASSVPYFDARCGERFEKPEEFSMALKRFRDRIASYRPREFLLEQSLDLDNNLRRLPLLTTL